MTISLTPPVTDQKIKRYARLLIAQGIFIVYTLVGFQIYLRYPSDAAFSVLTLSFGVVGLGATWIMYAMIKNFSLNRRVIGLTFATFFVSFMAGMIATNPVAPLPFDSTSYFVVALINQAGSFFSFSAIMILMINDIFNRSHPMRYRLLGAACIYFNIGIMFSFVYGTINILVPNAMGLHLPPEFISYMHCVNFSFVTLGGIDPVYDVNGIIRGVAIIESLFANLYVVLLIGRLLVK